MPHRASDFGEMFSAEDESGWECSTRMSDVKFFGIVFGKPEANRSIGMYRRK
jgi:hypothetical protein